MKVHLSSARGSLEDIAALILDAQLALEGAEARVGQADLISPSLRRRSRGLATLASALCVFAGVAFTSPRIPDPLDPLEAVAGHSLDNVHSIRRVDAAVSAFISTDV